LDEVDDTSILKTGRPLCYRWSLPWWPYSQTNRPPQRAIAQRFSALAQRVRYCGASECRLSGELRKSLARALERSKMTQL